MSNNPRYNNYGSYLRSRGFDKEICNIRTSLGDLTLVNGGTINGDLGVVGNLNINNNLNVDGNLNIEGNLDMSCNDMNNVNQISFCNGNTFDGTSQSLSSQKISIFRNDISYNIAGGSSQLVNFNEIIVNQLNLGISGGSNEFISPSLDISGQFVEIYMNLLVETTNNDTSIQFDISCTSGGSFFEEIGSSFVEGKNKQYFLTFGPHIFIPDEWAGCNEFNFILNNTGSNNLNIIKNKILFKSYSI